MKINTCSDDSLNLDRWKFESRKENAASPGASVREDILSETNASTTWTNLLENCLVASLYSSGGPEGEMILIGLNLMFFIPEKNNTTLTFIQNMYRELQRCDQTSSVSGGEHPKLYVSLIKLSTTRDIYQVSTHT